MYICVYLIEFEISFHIEIGQSIPNLVLRQTDHSIALRPTSAKFGNPTIFGFSVDFGNPTTSQPNSTSRLPCKEGCLYITHDETRGNIT